MNRIGFLFLAILNIYTIECQRLMRTSDIVPSFRARRSYDNYTDDSYEEFNILGEKYTITSKRTVRSVPVVLIGEDGVQRREADAEHQLYYDEHNGAAFTISKRNVNGQVERSLYGTVVKRDGTQLVLQPYTSLDSITSVTVRQFDALGGGKFDYVKREYDDEFDQVNREVKRDVGSLNNVVELGMVADYLYFQKAKEYLKTEDTQTVAAFIEAYFVQIASLASQTYERSLANSNLKLSIVLKFIYILTTESVSPFTSSQYQFNYQGKSQDSLGRTYLRDSKNLDAFNQWVKSNLAGVSFDTVASMTGGNIADDSSEDTVGLAPMEGTCTKKYKGFLVEDKFDFSSFTTLAHELAHNLGVNHDNDNNPNNNPKCSDDQGYIMAAVSSGQNPMNSFFFSPCSIDSLVSNIYQNNKFSCLANVVGLSDDLKKYVDFYPGQVYSLSDQCKRSSLGAKSIP